MCIRAHGLREVLSAVAEELGLTAAEIARHLGVNTSSITRTIERAACGEGTKSTVRNNVPEMRSYAYRKSLRAYIDFLPRLDAFLLRT